MLQRNVEKILNPREIERERERAERERDRDRERERGGRETERILKQSNCREI